jgi:c-di-GMP-related signal transduction protein
MFCELIGTKIEMFRETNELFLLGLLSVMDALLNMRMADVLADIPVDNNIKQALLGHPNRYRSIFEVVLDCESATWEQLTNSARQVGLHEAFLPDLYLRSVRWVTEILADVPILV